jgi:hypothetical protein
MAMLDQGGQYALCKRKAFILSPTSTQDVMEVSGALALRSRR